MIPPRLRQSAAQLAAAAPLSPRFAPALLAGLPDPALWNMTGDSGWRGPVQVLGDGSFVVLPLAAYGITGDDAANINAAFTYGNVVRLLPTADSPTATYSTSSTISMGPGQYLIMPGTQCVITYTGTGDAIRIVDTTAYSTRTVWGGGVIGRGMIDISGAVGASVSGVHLGDILQYELDVCVRDTVGSRHGVWIDNQYAQTEQLHGRVHVQGCSVQFDNSANISGTASGSFDRMVFDVFLESRGIADGVVFANGAQSIGHRLGIYGNMNNGTTQFSALKLTGSNGGGFSRLDHGWLYADVELDSVVNPTPPQTVTAGTVGSNNILSSRGFLNFSASGAFTSSNLTVATFEFDGPVYGDNNLTNLAQLRSPPAVQTVSANGTTLNPGRAGSLRVANGGSSWTGIIMPAGAAAGQRVMIMNVGAGTLTFDVAGTSRVADGVTDVIAANQGRTFIWDSSTSLWYRIG